MTGDQSIDPAVVACMDQVIANYLEHLAWITDTYREVRARGEGDLISTGALAGWLEETFETHTLASLLAVAVREAARQ